MIVIGRKWACRLLAAGATLAFAPAAPAAVRVSYTATCANPAGCGGFSVVVMDEEGRRTLMAQDCLACEASIPAASVSYGPRTPGQHTGAFSDDNPAAGRRFAVGLMATGANEPLSFSFRLIDPDGTEHAATATLSPDPRPVATQCTAIGATPPGPPLTVTTIGGSCVFGPPAPATPADPLAGLSRLPARTVGGATVYDLPAGFEAQAVQRASDGRFVFTAGFVGSLGTGGDLRVIGHPATGVAFAGGLLRGGDGNLWSNGVTAAPGGARASVLIRITPAGQITTFPLPDGISFATAGRGQDLWGIATAGSWTVARLSTAGSVTQLYRTSVRGQLAGMALGPDGTPWIGDGFGRLWRLARTGRLLRVGVPKDLFRRFLLRARDGLYYIDFLPHGRIGRVGSDLTVRRSCALPDFFDVGLAAGPRGVWFVVPHRPDLGLIKPSGEIVRYRNALPGASIAYAVAAAADGSVLVSYASGPRGDVRRQSGHLVRFRPTGGGARMCRTWAHR